MHWPDPVITTRRLSVRLPSVDDAPRVLAFWERNAERLKKWNPPYPQGFLTCDHWRERLTAAEREFAEGRSLRLVLFPREDDQGPAMGTCSFTGFVRGALQTTFVGFELDHEAVGRGLMTEALGPALEYAFEAMAFHRILANYHPTNERSGKLLKRLGFVVIGYAREAVFIDGGWRDHVMTALTNPNPRPPCL